MPRQADLETPDSIELWDDWITHEEAKSVLKCDSLFFEHARARGIISITFTFDDAFVLISPGREKDLRALVWESWARDTARAVLKEA